MGKAAKSVVAALVVTLLVTAAVFFHRMADGPAPVDPGLPSPPPGSTSRQVIAPPDGGAARPRVASEVSTVPAGTLLTISPDGMDLWFLDLQDRVFVLRHWNAASGDLRTIPQPPAERGSGNAPGAGAWGTDFSGSLAAVAAGLLEVGGQGADAGRIVLIDAQGGARAGGLRQRRTHPLLVPLRDGSVLAIGGKAGTKGDEPIFTNAVERISFAGQVPATTQLPDVPGEIRSGMAAVELADGRIMALGGSTSRYLGSEPMTADTYLLDLSSGTWQPGPRLLEPRTNASATLLPDGSVLVAGGWTPRGNWNTTAARSTERWRPGSAAFVPDGPLAQGAAGHQALWLPGREPARLVLAGGWVAAWRGNESIQVLDVSAEGWRLAGEGCVAEEKSGLLFFFPVAAPDGDGVWCQARVGQEWSRVALRPARAGPDRGVAFDPEVGIALRRAGIAFLPQSPDSPALALGGNPDGADSAGVDAIWPDGRIAALPGMTHARRGAHVLRFADGSIFVAGGIGRARSNDAQPAPAPEILPGGAGRTASRWIDLGLELPPGAAFARLGEAEAVAVAPDGTVEVLTFSALDTARPAVRRSPLPRMSRSWRMPDAQEPGEVAVKALADGRIVVAGGEAQADRIALFHDAVEDPTAPDRFAGYGAFAPARTHEIWDPVAKAWRESAPSRSAGGRTAILDDGRVVKWGPLAAPANEARPDEAPKGVLEISDADGMTWNTFEGSEAPTVTVDLAPRAAHPFVIDGELFLSGWHLNDVTPHYARGPRMLQRFDPVARRWVTLWQAPESNWKEHLGRVIVRELSPGRRVALPVEGP